MGRSALALALALVVAACGGDDDDAREVHFRPTQRAPLLSKSFYRIDGWPKQCVPQSPCEARFELTALGAYHLNEQYPFKFVPDTSPDIAVTGAPTFTMIGEKKLVMRIPIRLERAVNTQLRGTFKLSVCAADNCEIDAPTIAIAVPAG